MNCVLLSLVVLVCGESGDLSVSIEMEPNDAGPVVVWVQTSKRDGSSHTSANAQTHNVELQENGFVPAAIATQPGDQLSIKNRTESPVALSQVAPIRNRRVSNVEIEPGHTSVNQLDAADRFELMASKSGAKLLVLCNSSPAYIRVIDDGRSSVSFKEVPIGHAIVGLWNPKEGFISTKSIEATGSIEGKKLTHFIVPVVAEKETKLELKIRSDDR